MKYLVTTTFEVNDTSPTAAAEQVLTTLRDHRLDIHFAVTPQSVDGEFYSDNRMPVSIPGRASH